MPDGVYTWKAILIHFNDHMKSKGFNCNAKDMSLDIFIIHEPIHSGNPNREELILTRFAEIKRANFGNQNRTEKSGFSGRKKWKVVILTEGQGNPKDKQKCINDPATAEASTANPASWIIVWFDLQDFEGIEGLSIHIFMKF